jgi:hypothetical protein
MRRLQAGTSIALPMTIFDSTGAGFQVAKAAPGGLKAAV